MKIKELNVGLCSVVIRTVRGRKTEQEVSGIIKEGIQQRYLIVSGKDRQFSFGGGTAVISVDLSWNG